MKTTIFSTGILLTICCMILFAQGCGSGSSGTDSGTKPRKTPQRDAHAALHQPKYGGVFAEFPGHKYAVEIIDDEATGLVTAFVTDAHFDPTVVEATEVQLNFVVGGAPKTYTLSRIESDAGKPVTFTLTDAELAELICDGWQGDATVSVTIGGTPYKATLQTGEHNHTH